MEPRSDFACATERRRAQEGRLMTAVRRRAEYRDRGLVSTMMPRSRSAQRRAWFLSLPSVLIMLLLTLTPTISLIVEALSSKGIEQFKALTETPGFGSMLLHTLLWIIYCVVGTLLIGYGAAFALNYRGLRAPGLWRTLLLIPWITAIVVAAVAWKWLFSENYGLLNEALIVLHVIDHPVNWLTNFDIILPTLAMVQVWATFPFVMLLVTAGLQAIPAAQYEAAKIDGAGPWRQLRYITLPSIRDITFIVALMVTVWSANSFVPIWIITQGGPAGSSDILSVALYQAFQNGDSTSVAVMAVIQLLVSLAIGVAYVIRTRKDWAA